MDNAFITLVICFNELLTQLFLLNVLILVLVG